MIGSFKISSANQMCHYYLLGSLGSRPTSNTIATSKSHSLPPVRQSSRDSFTLTHEVSVQQNIWLICLSMSVIVQFSLQPHSGILSRRTKVKIGFAVIFRPEPSDSRWEIDFNTAQLKHYFHYQRYLSIIFCFSEFQQFFFEHFPLFESYVTFLKEQVENALNNSKKVRKAEFVENMMDVRRLGFTDRLGRMSLC